MNLCGNPTSSVAQATGPVRPLVATLASTLLLATMLSGTPLRAQETAETAAPSLDDTPPVDETPAEAVSTTSVAARSHPAPTITIGMLTDSAARRRDSRA